MIQMKRINSIISESFNNVSMTTSNMINQENTQAMDEVSKQIFYLQTKINHVTKNKIKTVHYHSKHIETKTEENASLLNELNSLRINYKHLMSVKNYLTTTNNQLQREIKSLNSELKSLKEHLKFNDMSDSFKNNETNEMEKTSNSNFKIKIVGRTASSLQKEIN